jgi:cell division protein FtsB
MRTIQKALIVAALVASIGIAIYEAHNAAGFASKITGLEQGKSEDANQIAQIKETLADSEDKLAALEAENRQLRAQIASIKSASDELGQNRSQDAAVTADQAPKIMGAWLDRVAKLKQRFGDAPELGIPELQLLTDEDWLFVTTGGLNNDNEFREEMYAARDNAVNRFLNDWAEPALKKYLTANDGAFPADITQLQPFFSQPIDPAILQRYKVVPASQIPGLKINGQWIITERNGEDPATDSGMRTITYISADGTETVAGFK